jgi:hypothetical protein
VSGQALALTKGDAMPTPITAIVAEMSDFMQSECRRFVTEDLNGFNTVFGNLLTYLRMLGIIDLRQQEVFGNLKALLDERLEGIPVKQRFPVQTDAALLGLSMSRGDWEMQYWGIRAQVEMESLYLFAKILLDRSAYALQYYFGLIDGTRKKPQVSGNLIQRWHEFVTAKCLIQTSSFETSAADLYYVAKFRDDQIAHESDPKTSRGGVQCTPDGLILKFGLFYPKPGDKQHPDSLPAKEVFVRLHAYFKAFTRLIVDNKDKTVLRKATI